MKRILNLLVLVLLANIAVAQAPQGIPYQAVARNSSGAILASTAVSVRFTIRDSIASGAIKYRETFAVTTTAQGMFNVNVGQGTPVTGTFAGINWGSNAKFMQVEMDPSGGSSYVDMGTQQMMSVPYALYAGQTYNSLTSGHTINTGFTTSGTWTCPAGVTSIMVQLWGGGGGGSQATGSTGCYFAGGSCGYRQGACGGAGGSGGYNRAIISVIPGNSYSITVGSGGSGGAASVDGTDGQITSFNGILSAAGGTRGTGAGVSSSTCWGGIAGINGSVINYVPSEIVYYNVSSTSDRSYIPSNYTTIGSYPSCCATGGGAGSAGCLVVWGSCGIGCCGGGGLTGGNGQAGYCVISY
jgi:hypothetical protein